MASAWGLVDAPELTAPYGEGVKEPQGVRSHLEMSSVGSSYRSPWPVSQSPSPVLQVGSQHSGTAPVTAQVTSQTRWALSCVPRVPPNSLAVP